MAYTLEQNLLSKMIESSESRTLEQNKKKEVSKSKKNKAVEEIEKAWKYIQVESKLFLCNKYFETLGNTPWPILCLKFSPDSKYLVSPLDKTIKLWNLAENKEELILDGKNEEIYSLLFSHDGKYILSGGENALINIWNIAEGKLEESLIGHVNSVKNYPLILMGNY